MALVPVTVVSDNFNRADSASLGAAWNDNSGAFYIGGNKARLGAGGMKSCNYLTAVGSADQWAQGTVVLGGNFDEFGVILRVSNEANFYYVAFDRSSSGTCYLRKRVSYSQTTLATGTFSMPLGTYTVYAEIKGNAVIVKVNGTQVLSANVDGTFNTNQYVGLAGSIISSTATYWDDFTGGIFAEPALPGGWGVDIR